MARVLVTRPRVDAERLAARLEAAGHEAIVSPLLDVEPVAWDLPEAAYDAVLFTSRQAPPAVAGRAAALARVPVFPIGPGTHAACVDAGFGDVRPHAEGDLDGILASLIASGARTVLWLSGEQVSRDPAPVLAQHGISVLRRIVYRAQLAGRFTPEAEAALAANRIDWALLLSPRTATRFVELYDAVQGADPASLSLGCISDQVAARVAGKPWRAVAVAEQPTEASLLAATLALCHKQALPDPEGER
ncbi:uroporphyrinogen-III synthase [Pedomonas mirosovicensis]|uniref:uroporphyrinogen-III synthase n=1 Tax=Pedomonas mirosovicensis TaxID=2908641 RepID=UPI00216921B2|nr:uroporphyrinogen-III synthase [Pedomonas mirosovicensis]MCH8683965.1 uroporphyrinogen-III synthase [Pedomonas mirosovicensis]